MMIESYLWAGSAIGPLYAQAAKVTQGVTVSTARTTAPARASETLDHWVSEWTTATGSTYAWRWDRAAHRITIYKSGVANFDLELLGSAAAALGFASSTYSGATSYTAEGPPLVFARPVAIEYGAPIDAGELRLRALRYGRHRSAWWSGHDALEVRVLVRAADAAALAGYILRGRVRIDCRGQSTAAATSGDLDGWIDGYVAGVGAARELDNGAHVEVELAIVRSESADYAATGRIYDALQYGHTLFYWMTIEGLPYVWSEGLAGAATGKTLPAGYGAELPDLDVTGSPPVGATVDRDKGLGAGLPFQFRLVDSDTVRGLLVRWSKYLRLRSSLTATATSIDVEDATGWSAGDRFWLGTELIEIGAVGAGPTLTGCTRAIVGYPYAVRRDEASSYGTDKPRWWRGRHCSLYAVSVDPSGSLPADAALATHSAAIWRGRIDTGPQLSDDGLWSFSALALDRQLARPLTSTLSGEVVSTAFRAKAIPSANITLKFTATLAGAAAWEYVVSWEPFASLTASDLISQSQALALIGSTWSTAVTTAGAGAKLGEMTFQQYNWYKLGVYEPGETQVQTNLQQWLVEFLNPAADEIRITGTVFGTQIDRTRITGAASFANPSTLEMGIKTGINPYAVNQTQAKTNNTHATINVEGDPADAPSSGMVAIGDVLHTYELAGVSGGMLSLAGIRVADGGKISSEAFVGQSAEILITLEDTLGDAVVTALESSGTGQRGVYDTAPEGYGLDDELLDETTIRSLLNSGAMSSEPVRLVYRDRSLIDLIGGLLSLQQRALVGRQLETAPHDYALTVVETSAAGSLAVATIKDADLIVGDGDSARTLTDRRFVNQIKIQGDLGDDGPTVNVIDAQSVQANGAKALEVVVPIAKRHDLVELARSWAFARFASDQALQALELRVAPWIVADVGDIVKLELSHFRIWTFATSAHGYTGLGRVIGRTFDLDKQAATLTVLVDGLNLTAGLCPSAEVQGFDNATAPTYVDVEARFLTHFQATLDDVSSALVTIYRPGEVEGIAEQLEINAAAIVGGACRLTVASVIGAPTLVAGSSHLTVPPTSDSNQHQSLYMHDGDGSVYA